MKFRLQPLEGKLSPAQFHAENPGARHRGTASLCLRLDVILHRRQTERTVEPVRVAQDGPDRLPAERDVVLAAEADHQFMVKKSGEDSSAAAQG